MSMPNTAFGGSVESAQRSTLSRSRTGMGGGITGKLPPPVSVPRKNSRRCRSRPTFHAGWWIRHAALAASRAPERKRLARKWELRGLLRCSCGWIMTTHTATSRGNGADYHYYVCNQRKDRGRECDCTQRAVRATEAERVVWTFVSNLLREPETIRVGMERLIEEERTSQAQNPEHEAELWAQRIAEQELAAVKDHRRRVQDLEQDRDALLESMAEMVPEALDSLTGEEKSRVYRMLRLEVTPTTEGYDVSGAICTSVTPSG